MDGSSRNMTIDFMASPQYRDGARRVESPTKAHIFLHQALKRREVFGESVSLRASCIVKTAREAGCLAYGEGGG